MNRVKNSAQFPHAIHPVVFAPNQFSPVTNGAYDRAKPSALVKNAVTNVLNGKDNSRGALYFRTIRGAEGSWHEKALERLFDHGGHRFYK